MEDNKISANLYSELINYIIENDPVFSPLVKPVKTPDISGAISVNKSEINKSADLSFIELELLKYRSNMASKLESNREQNAGTSSDKQTSDLIVQNETITQDSKQNHYFISEEEFRQLKTKGIVYKSDIIAQKKKRPFLRFLLLLLLLVGGFFVYRLFSDSDVKTPAISNPINQQETSISTETNNNTETVNNNSPAVNFSAGCYEAEDARLKLFNNDYFIYEQGDDCRLGTYHLSGRNVELRCLYRGKAGSDLYKVDEPYSLTYNSDGSISDGSLSLTNSETQSDYTDYLDIMNTSNLKFDTFEYKSSSNLDKQNGIRIYSRNGITYQDGTKINITEGYIGFLQLKYDNIMRIRNSIDTSTKSNIVGHVYDYVILPFYDVQNNGEFDWYKIDDVNGYWMADDGTWLTIIKTK